MSSNSPQRQAYHLLQATLTDAHDKVKRQLLQDLPGLGNQAVRDQLAEPHRVAKRDATAKNRIAQGKLWQQNEPAVQALTANFKQAQRDLRHAIADLQGYINNMGTANRALGIAAELLEL